jgi:hypothetical protein
MALERDDLNRLEDRLTEAMAAGFSGVHSRLDSLNGRTRTNENNIVRIQERLKQTQKPSHWPKIGGFSGIAAMLAEVGKWYFAK